MGFPAHAQGRGTPPLHSDWPKVSVKARQSELYKYSWIWKITAVKSEVSESSVSSKDARQRCLRVRWCDLLMAYSLEWGNPCFATLVSHPTARILNPPLQFGLLGFNASATARITVIRNPYSIRSELTTLILTYI